MQYLIASGLTLVLLGVWFKGTRFSLWSLLLAAVLWSWFEPPLLFWLVYLPLNALLLYPPLRSKLLTKHIVALVKQKNLMPKISETEKTALRAGTLWIDGEYFSGKPDFERIFKESYPQLTVQEQAFLDNEVNTLCAMTNDHKVFQERDLPPEVWAYLKKHNLFGMVIPKAYGGLGFSALGHSAVVQKLASRSQVLAITAMVPNSIGPGELILEHGTEYQKKHYLPRLADGREIPCFALTEPLVGSDATAINATGVLFKDEKGEVKIRLDFEKRYITLGAVATLLGLAFVLKDPDALFGDEKDLGITFALVPNTLEGVDQDHRHDPLGVPFINSSLYGKDVILEIDMIVGAKAGIGKGWQMLMESLSVGRGISLPSTSSGGIKLTAHVAGAYTTIREQFGISISQFEGIQYELGQIAATTYMMDAARIFTIGAIDAGEKPAVINAVMKYHATERFRDVINSGMDILGGAGIILGEKNLIGHAYMGAPIGITVEGANIMTRTLIQFGQGVIRCHPYAYSEIEALEAGDIAAFDKLFFAHIGFALRNSVRTKLLFLSRGYLHFSKSDAFVLKYERKLAWSAATFAAMTDVVMGLYGGGFKQKEMLSARFGDVLSWMYLLTATLRRFEAEGRKEEDKVYVEFIGAQALSEIQKAFDAIYANIGNGFVHFVFKNIIGYATKLNALASEPNDKLYIALAAKLSQENATRQTLTEGIYIPDDPKAAMAEMDHCFEAVLQAKPIKVKIKKALKAKQLHKSETLFEDALAAKIITQEEYQYVIQTQRESENVVQVDAFSVQDYLARK